MSTYKLGKTCKVCGKKLADNNKTGYCSIHRDRKGSNNSFFGKKHSQETLNKLKESCQKASEEKWKDPEYRNHVIEGLTGLKRSQEFKDLQREHAFEQFKDKNQRDMRSKKMKETWKSGKITINSYPSINKSKKEITIMEALKESLGENFKTEQTLKYEEKNEVKWLFPDGIYKNIVIEFNGDYWHANPNKYKPNDIVHHNLTAKEIWEQDIKKKELYESLGYKVYYIWEEDYKKDFQGLIEKVNKDLLKEG